METHAFGFRLRANAPEGQKQFPISKDPTSGTITNVSVSVFEETKVIVDKVTGTPSATPALPSTPSDGGGNYYIPLAYVLIPDGSTLSSIIDLKTQILNQAPVRPISRSTGISSIQPATSLWKPDGGALSSTRISDWAASGTRPNYYVPREMHGEETLWVVIDCVDGDSANWSHQDDGIIDDSRDWRNRFFTWMAVARNGSGRFPWDFTVTNAHPIPGADVNDG